MAMTIGWLVSWLVSCSVGWLVHFGAEWLVGPLVILVSAGFRHMTRVTWLKSQSNLK